MRSILIGFLIGILIPILGVTIHGEISQVVGDILLMPTYILSGLFNEPFWYLDSIQKSILFFSCGLFYAFVLGLIQVMPNLESKTYN
ncbi:hypothetical protein [Arcobacter arenosus]|jgi:MFS-type transporter involved in bile tolerance (Atg22 family)|uniref:Sodium:proton antiporter n=1 Tax=Arcobacter arenosus TaxID=2576037 RepID=A0A5R8Y312_9BACT|nr:hypothetical protein [Arcobacter arenosus]TLP40445.1 hypothetical protein FDK22_00075 [Arcobacter arenosus]